MYESLHLKYVKLMEGAKWLKGQKQKNEQSFFVEVKRVKALFQKRLDKAILSISDTKNLMEEDVEDIFMNKSIQLSRIDVADVNDPK
jgi:hypothetical protein